MLNFQNQDCNTSLQEGIEEYRSYLRKNNRYVLGEEVSDPEKWGILCHDATHVIFGLDTTLEEEAMLDCWVFFGGPYCAHGGHSWSRDIFCLFVQRVSWIGF